MPLTATLCPYPYLPRFVSLGVALFERRSYGRKPSVCGLQSNQGTRRYRGRPRPVPGEPRTGEPNVAQGHLSLAVALVRKQEHVLCERCEIGLVLPFRFVHKEWQPGRRERHRLRGGNGAVLRLCRGEADR